ncbi:carbon-phosphorus lyase [Actibacterium mucosum KCTC 23349]|uniref:Carbon-phosphorus lyase n=1 Tax=Actibacterium mucosum KCTC 23349 TaxID=1454373 RepID=A0A037ZLF5_9RHOB|nr:phosphonate C-P lyase system protein PhnH [Actibacterium mucosum]KAJ55681.1 carbon-phosphorus lyase [Actibacterium mucosum KCTC 23349]
MQETSLTGGFTDAPIDAAHAFRAALTVMAEPGKIAELSGAEPPAPMSVAAGTLLLTLADSETPVFLAPTHDNQDIRDWITFHTGAPIVSAEKAMFAIGGWSALQPTVRFAIGEPEYPDRSATLIIEMPELSNSGATLRGPGIKDTRQFQLPDTAAFQANQSMFPLGLDFFFCAGSQVAALPRTTLVEGA